MSPWPGALRLRRHRPDLAIVRLPVGSPLPHWACSPSPLSSITWNSRETSVICPADAVPEDITQAGPFHAFEIVGPLTFTFANVLNGLLSPLADQQISVFTVSTFDTDWILVPTHQAEAAIEVWRQHGQTVEVDEPQTPEQDMSVPARSETGLGQQENP